MRLAIALKLARVSNLPTVWTNVMAGAVLAGAGWTDPGLPLAMVALSLFYTGGMFLNDAHDRDFDTRFRPDRPIPAGDVTAAQVFGWGYGMMAAGLGLLAVAARMSDDATPWGAPLGGVLLAGCIVLYDAWHKSNPLSPLVMGLCRMLVYVTAALAVVAVPGAAVYLGAGVSLAYLIGLTYAAKKEHLDRLDHAWPLAFLLVPVIYGGMLAIEHPLALVPLVLFTGWAGMAVKRLFRRGPGDVPKAVVALIAGISLLDAVILAGHGAPVAALLAVAAFGVTLRLQRWVAGT
jgi:hypothetical protein